MRTTPAIIAAACLALSGCAGFNISAGPPSAGASPAPAASAADHVVLTTGQALDTAVLAADSINVAATTWANSGQAKPADAVRVRDLLDKLDACLTVAHAAWKLGDIATTGSNVAAALTAVADVQALIKPH